MARSSGGDATRTAAVLAFPGVQALDVVGPLEVFGRTARWLRDERGWTAPAFQPVVVARRRGPLPSSSGCSLVAARPLSRLGGPFDTLLVAGGQGLAPLLDDLGLHAWLKERGNLHAGDPRYTGRLALTDGGVYDNMGLEAVWNRYQTVLVSDAGAPFDADPTPWSNWFSTTRRAFNVAIEQARSLRRRWLVREYRAGRLEGAYWSIGTRIDGYGLPDALARDGEATGALARLRTRLDAFSSGEQVRLVNWGYALCDAAVRRRLPELAAAAGRLPYPPPPAG